MDRDAAQRPRQQLAVAGPPLQQHRIVAEAIEEDFVLTIQQIVQEPIERALRRLDLFARHAAARVERHAETDRHPLRAEVRHRHWLIVFVDDEVVGRQSGDETSGGIAHGRRHVDQLDTGLESKPLVLGRPGRGLRLTAHRHDQQRPDERGDGARVRDPAHRSQPLS